MSRIEHFRSIPKLNAFAFALLAVVGLGLLGGHRGGQAESVEAETLWVEVPEDFEPGEPMKIDRPAQSEHCRDGVARFIDGAGWENRRFPEGTDRLWRAFDSQAAVPGLTDEIMWGRAECEASVGEASAWAVGGGTVGGTLSCEDKQYPTDLGPGCRTFGDCRVQTSLQFLTFDASEVPNGIRLTFDYKAKMPPGALFRVGVGDFGRRTEAGFPLVKWYDDFETDTGDEWVGGHVLEFDEAAGIEELVITFIYEHNPAVSGGYGVFLDNVHADAKFRPNPPLCPSPPTPFPTPSDTPTITPTRIVFTPRPDTPTPAPTRETKINMPVAFKNFAPPPDPTSVPTAPTPTPAPPTATPTDTPTPVPTPSNTARPSDTATPTRTATHTPFPEPDVQIDKVFYVSPGAINVQRVILRNFGTGEEELTRWSVFARARAKTCEIPDGVTLGPDEEYYVLAGSDADEEAAKTPGQAVVCDGTRYVFGQNEDEAQLINHLRRVIDRYCWTVGGPYVCREGLAAE